MNTAQAVHEDSKTGSNKVYKIALTGLHFYSLRSIFQAEMQHLFILEMQSAF